MRFTGKLKTWTDDRGFGFITPTDGGQDIFVHISEYPRGQIPALNEMLSFEVALNREGKKKAVKVQLAGAPLARTRPGPDSHGSRVPTARRAPATKGGLAKMLVALTMLVLAGWAAYRYYPQAAQWAASPALSHHNKEPATAVGLPEPRRATFRCDGRTRCSQMTSCAEATFFLQNCPGTQMDGNHDGVPCEQQWCR